MNQIEVKEMRKKVKKYVDIADDKVVKLFYVMMEVEQEEDWWDKLPNNIRTEIDQSLADLDNGKGIPHEEILKKYSRWFATK